MLDPLARVTRAAQLIDGGKVFTLYAGRQTGKTTCVMSLRQAINKQGKFLALWVDLERARELPEARPAMASILGVFQDTLRWSQTPSLAPAPEQIDAWLQEPSSAVRRYLTALSAASERPVVLFLDEVDGLVGPAMVSFLTQLREGYIARAEQPFPWSIVLVGMRQVRDYSLSSDDRRLVSWLGTTSPFNIAVEAQTLTPFSRPDSAALLAQHTAATGQGFEPKAIELLQYYAQGHPWLTNALADVCVDRLVPDRSLPILWRHVEEAKELLIRERRTHIDSLIARLREERVRRVLEPMLTGMSFRADTLDDDLAYVVGLGLIRVSDGLARIANPIYREVIPRALTYMTQISLFQETSWYLGPNDALDMPKLMAAWQHFWRKDGHLAAEGFGYREAGPHLMLMAFLQRIINGGGCIEREYALGKGALDLLIEWKTQRVAIELKMRRARKKGWRSSRAIWDAWARRTGGSCCSTCAKRSAGKRKSSLAPSSATASRCT